MPEWVFRLDVPTWVTRPGRRVLYLNGPAEELLGRRLDACRGSPCHEVVGALDRDGAPFCRAGCAPARSAAAGEKLGAFLLRIGRGAEDGRWYEVLVIPIQTSGGGSDLLVHCALDADRRLRIERYLTTVAERSASLRKGAPPSAVENLSPRELEILRHLARDEDVQRVAATLHLSYFTVRNHVRHVLEKLRVHSVAEAVAVYLLSGEDERA